MDRMPYLCAFIKDVLRWRPTVPLIPPHELTEDLEYEGNTFRKGTLFLVNNTAVSYDHQDPDKFYPERWLDGNESNVMHGLFAFGGGRRVCIGYRIEQQVLFTALSRLIFSFDYTPVSFVFYQ
jgi:cytochrome P450